jgi:23S rRNA maturation-related 3'-5' exoribonuclease YhaM|tara:strand:+ start:109 stop:735 length:627 start_codon:yes stop_codon:yes gene_type:complete
MDKEGITANIKQVEQIVDKYVVSDRKVLLTHILETLGPRLFISSASSKKEYHSCEPGGLLNHSLNVTNTMLTLNTPIYNCDPESIVIVGLLHDIGKIGSVTDVATGDGLPFYIDQQSDWHREKLGQLYKKNPELNDFLTHSLRSIRILTQFNFPLSDDEFVTIFAHDAHFEIQNQSLDIMRCTYSLLKLAQAGDQMATLHEKELFKNA